MSVKSKGCASGRWGYSTGDATEKLLRQVAVLGTPQPSPVTPSTSILKLWQSLAGS